MKGVDAMRRYGKCVRIGRRMVPCVQVGLIMVPLMVFAHKESSRSGGQRKKDSV